MLITTGGKKILRRAVKAVNRQFPRRTPSPVARCPSASASRLSNVGLPGRHKQFRGKIKKKIRQAQLWILVETIRNAGPKGRAFIRSLERDILTTRLYVARKAKDKDGRVSRLTRNGGGLTILLNSRTGDTEVYIHPTYRIRYQATDGSKVRETSAGLLLHELGHAWLFNHLRPNTEAAVRKLTNPIRRELGMKPD